MGYNLMPVDIENSGGKLSLNRVNSSLDYLLIIQGQDPVLLVGDQLRRKSFLRTLGRSATFYFSDFPQNPSQLEIDGNYPHLYIGRSFLTKSGHKYSLDENFRFHGRESMEGAKVSRIAGIPFSLRSGFSLALGEGLEQADSFLLEHGNLITIDKIIESFKIGDPLCLALTLDKEEVVKYGRIGFVSSPVVKLE